MQKVLILLPAAGSTGSSFANLQDNLDIQTFAIEYSGHWQRYKEPLYFEKKDFIRDVISQINRFVDIQRSELYFLGHSMGAYVALITKSVLKSEYGVSVKKLILSSALTPNDFKLSSGMEKNDDGIIEFLTGIGQINSKIIKSALFQENLLPAIKADLTVLLEFHKFIATAQTINEPVFAIGGKNDAMITSDDLSHWKGICRNGFRMQLFSGGHFYLYDKSICKEIGNAIDEFAM